MAQTHPTFAELEDTARTAISYLKQNQEFSNAKIALIGGVALWKHLPGGRSTEDVDFMITVSGAPQAVKSKLLQLPNSPFAEFAQLFVYNHPGGKKIQVDFTPDWQSAFVPAAATPISMVNPDALPYISPQDLLALKINTCGMRPTPVKRAQVASDAKAIADFILKQGPIILTAAQKAAVQGGLEDVIKFSSWGADWWENALQL
ncbi:hypothetical protein McanMca71_006180 [Microsporum canis]|uniref:Uncharacterized protein n=1 Tax=Arthroderma otae (strain ATCC MYA-4605 / CBS 113480) TaxID=554155 RepID=C5FPJ6_ARTOC|nr:conserved hypothetical protein [Microsporum canis CBS 113480]EEQ31512.1 conserved hypothetical protein [Microsporum canis CBS 113480]